MIFITDLDELKSRRRRLNRLCDYGMLMLDAISDDRVFNHDLQCRLEGTMRAYDYSLTCDKVFEH